MANETKNAPNPWEAFGAAMGRIETAYKTTVDKAKADRKAAIRKAKADRDAALKAAKETPAVKAA